MSTWINTLPTYRRVEAKLLDAFEQVGMKAVTDLECVGALGFHVHDFTVDKLQKAMEIAGYISQGVMLFPMDGDYFVMNGQVMAVVCNGGRYLEFSGY